MKHLAAIAFLLMVLPSKAQTVTSIADGSWDDPATWDCACVPSIGDTINVDHLVGMGQDFASSSGGLFIGAGGTIIGAPGVILQFGGAFRNDGALIFEHLSLWPNQFATAINTGEITVEKLFILTMGGFTNEGSIATDSLFVGTDIANEASGVLIVQNYQGLGWCENSGSMILTTVELAMIGNTGTVLVTGDAYQFSFYGGGIEVLGDAWLQSISTSGPVHVHGNVVMEGSANMVAGPMQVDGGLLVEGNLYLPLNSALLSIGEDLWVTGSVGGQGGSICVVDSVINEGLINGLVDLCDLSPTVLVPPFVDVDNGTIGSGVTFCASGACAVAIGERSSAQLSIAPNPAHDHVTFEGMPAGAELRIYDGLGQLVLTPGVASGAKTTVDLGGLPKGIYLATATKGMERLTTRLVVE